MTKLILKLALLTIKLYNLKGVQAFPLYYEIYFNLLESIFYKTIRE